MTRVTSRPWLRNSFACAIVVAAGGLLYVKSMPASADPAGLHDLGDLAGGVSSIEIPAMSDSDGASNSGESGSDTDLIKGKEALELLVLHLEKAHRKLANSTGYTAKMFRQERVNGDLLDEEIMSLKVKHAPFGVYMKWIQGSPGQEVLYVDGDHNGNMIVKPGGFKGRFLSALELDPAGDLAMENSRHCITEAGLLNLAEEMLKNRRSDIEAGTVKCRMADGQEFDGRTCVCFVVEFPSEDYLGDYRKSVVFIDQDNSLPVLVRNYGWPTDDVSADELDSETLIESYAYSQIRMDAQFVAADFDRSNQDYRLH